MPTIIPTHDAMVLIGRFELFHLGHLEVMTQALRQGKKLITLVGSARSPRSYRNPFLFSERERMIRESLHEIDTGFNDRTRVVPLPDLLYNDEQWIKDAQRLVNEQLEPNETVSLIGHAKDGTSFYLNMFPTWGSTAVANYRNLSSTPMRTMYFSNAGEMWLRDADGHRDGDTPRDRVITTAVKRFLDEFIKTPDYRYVYDEFEYITNYRKPYLGLPYPPTFVTVDACVIQSGHILLVRRKTQPGKNLWAMPGGFIRDDEPLEDATLRELREETTIDINDRILQGSIKEVKVFADPFRSSRGRTITHATLFHLQRRRKLPTVIGADDASEARWFPLSEVVPEMMFEDHFSISSYFAGKL